MNYVLPGLLGITTIGLALLLRRMPFATVRLTRLPELEAAYVPPRLVASRKEWGPLPVAIDSARPPMLLQELVRLAKETGVAPLSGEDGLDAGVRLMTFLQARIPQGQPSIEYVDWRYDPRRAFRTHVVDGYPGHCVTRSSLAAALLAGWGHAARVVTFTDEAAQLGHTVLEVWSGREKKWVFVDSNAPVIARTGSATANIGDYWPDRDEWELVDWSERRKIEGRWPDRLDLLGTGKVARVYFPESWLYLRCVTKVRTWSRSEWAFFEFKRGTFGNVQAVLKIGLATAALASVASVAVVLLTR